MPHNVFLNIDISYICLTAGFDGFPLSQLPSCLRKARTPNWYERHNILRGEIVTLSGHKVNNFFYSTGKKKLLAPNLFPISFPSWTKKTSWATSMTIFFLCLKKEHTRTRRSPQPQNGGKLFFHTKYFVCIWQRTAETVVMNSWVHSHAPSIRPPRGIKVAFPDFQPMWVLSEPVCIYLFLQI